MVVYEPPVVYYDAKDKRLGENQFGYDMVVNGGDACTCPIQRQKRCDEYMASYYKTRTYNGD